MKRITTLAAGLLLAFAAHASGGTPGDEIRPTWEKTSFTVKVNFLPTMRSVALKCAEFGAWGGNARGAVTAARGMPIGCARIIHDENVCEVYVARPEQIDDAKVTVLGHEVLHCILGKYHD